MWVIYNGASLINCAHLVPYTLSTYAYGKKDWWGIKFDSISEKHQTAKLKPLPNFPIVQFTEQVAIYQGSSQKSVWEPQNFN